eukprot:TRINITY_DN322_c1_g1_i1.p1 TRINITY_DN322_c1_g1~~TRINITY_DN322_c1_g1_i1.p1  ORF type:complete len:982 (+),score=393.74 TRINITY_DN322_c1_g1_i1:131-3076(+)
MAADGVMDITLVACASSAPSGGSECLRVGDGQLEFRAPEELREAGFPQQDVKFAFEHTARNINADTLHSKYLKTASLDLFDRQNTVVFAAGQRATPKRQLLFGEPQRPETGTLWKVMQGVCSASGFKSVNLSCTCYAVGSGDRIADILNLDNQTGVMKDSLKGPPTVKNLTTIPIRSWQDGQRALKTVNANYPKHFADVLGEAREKPFANYNPDNLVFCMRTFAPDAPTGEDDEHESHGRPGDDHDRKEMNSIHFIALGDSERPGLCGINTDVMKQYEETQKTLSAIVGILGAIRCNRLRVPYGKCRLTHLLKRAYNAEKGNEHNEVNKPTRSILVCHCFENDRYAEETFHGLTFAKRIMNVIGGGPGIGPASRDLAIEKWRLEQDIIELKDELEIAKAVHGYKPCIYNQAKPVANIKEEEQKRISKIQEMREKQRAEQQAQMQAQAMEEARQFIDKEQQKANQNLKELEKQLKAKLLENSELNEERDRKMEECDKQLKKIRKKREEEEEKTEKLRKDIQEIEQQLNARQESIQKKREELEVLSKDHAKGRELILAGRQETKAKREQVAKERKERRQDWLKEIKAANERVLAQIRQLEETRKLPGQQQPQADDDEDTEQNVREDIESIDRFLPRLISVEETSSIDEKCEEVRKQLENYFDSERQAFEEKLVQEQTRREQLERAAETFRQRISEQQNKVKKDQLTEAMKKERHLEGLIEQVIQYLEHGCRMTKIPSKGGARKRYFYISDDRKRILSCEMDEMGMPRDRKKPTSTVYFRDIRRIILGQFTSSFKSFEKEGGVPATQPGDVLDDDEGAYNPSPTPSVTPQNIGKYFYRSFSFEFKKGKTLDVVTETDSDFEAWIVALKRLLGTKNEWEKVQDPKKGNVLDEPPTVEWGVPLEITQKPGIDRLMSEEVQLCSDNHITPMQYVNAKTEIINKAQSSFVTVYDVRTLSSLDLLRSRVVYEYFVRKKLIPSPSTTDIR